MKAKMLIIGIMFLVLASSVFAQESQPNNFFQNLFSKIKLFFQGTKQDIPPITSMTAPRSFYVPDKSKNTEPVINVDNPIKIRLVVNKADLERARKIYLIDNEAKIIYNRGVKITENVYYFRGLKNEIINPSYFDGVRKIRLVNGYSGYPFKNNDKLECGHYYTLFNSTEIDLNLNSLCNDRELLLHELKHNWCWVNKHEDTPTHKGCFLNTPIDREYGYVG